MTNEQKRVIHTEKLEDGRYRTTINGAAFYVKHHYGKVPLEEILKRRILAECGQEQ